jgi:uncharacterized protein (TIRG00374 family)
MGANPDPPPERQPDLEQQATEAVLAARPRFSVGRAVALVLTAVSLYLLAPSIVEVLSAWDTLDDFNPLALPMVLVLESLSFACVWLLQSIALRRKQWDAIVLSQLAANAFSRVVPGGGATSTAVQARMLSDAGFDLTRAATAVTVQSLMITASVVALPLFVIPGMVMGTRLPGNLLHAAWIGIGVFAVMIAAGTVLLATRRPVHALGGVIQRVTNFVRFRRPPVSGLADRLVVERDEIRTTMGSRWPEAVGAAVGRWGFEYAVLLVALYAIGASPDPWSVLLAFSAAALLSFIPLTPGGLGFVEAGLTATLAAAGIGAEKALAATLLYRLVSFWLPLPIGAVAGWWFRRRYPRQVRA